MSDKAVYVIEGDFSDIDDVTNLLLNMSGGLLPEDLSEEEVNMLKEKYGEDWFEELGYTEPEYRKPKF